MAALISQVISWPTLAIALLVYGFAPGAVLRLIVLLYPRDDPRRRELLGDLYAVPRIERPFWVIEQLEVALFEGLRRRFARRTPDALARVHERVDVFTTELVPRPVTFALLHSSCSNGEVGK